MPASASAGYAGDVSASETWGALSSDPDALLVDVRTRAEWTYVGVPRLDGIGKQPVLIEWQSYPAMTVAEDFSARLQAELAKRGVPKDAPLYFICRSGSRSRSAAMAMAASGYPHCFNVADGFEGPLDAERRRGAAGGWKAAGLPWVQT